ncbi:ABC transporter substrate-binding protein [Paenibacillus aceris]|uniref:Aldouronate transport system substrate-binding protein n=1 Tax=Paenibacillus aceris TaxID=869555 RepID=A0ABS4I350_9BACL|nr:ABC transporter substrate-binding protein [Paenibacillus aceris]MBP1965343.1 putative aldouronate transport system substrate-binding protein [Paenibacillus aceris]NHW36023.1 ABC transporter substrate-binding protein [Paenibacillus aceris]
MIKRESTRFKLIVAILFAVASLLPGCEAKEPANGKPADQGQATGRPSLNDLPQVELVYYFPSLPQRDLKEVNDELNRIIGPEIHATVKLNMIDLGNYDQKMNFMIASGESFDLAFTSTWVNNYYQNVAKGAYVAIDDLLEKYGPKTKAGVPDYIWNAAKVNGKLYGVINYQVMATSYGFDVQKELADKYHFDWKNAKTFEDLDPYLDAVKKGEPNKIPLEYSTTSDLFVGAAPLYGFDIIGDQKMPGWVRLNDKDFKVVNQYETPEFKKLIAQSRKWYEKGYFRKDAATTKEIAVDRKAARYAMAMPAYQTNDSTEDSFSDKGLKAITGVEWYRKRFTKPIITTDRAAATITAISRTSKNPDRAMMFLELMNSDPQVANLLNFGIEGKHYKKISDTRIERIKDSGYDPNFPWVFGNNLILWNTENDEPDNPEKWDLLNKSSDLSPILGFTFNMEAVKSEIAQCQVVIDQYLSALTTGTADPDKIQPEFIDKLKKSGVDKVIAEKQKQLDEWRKVSGK